MAKYNKTEVNSSGAFNTEQKNVLRKVLDSVHISQLVGPSGSYTVTKLPATGNSVDTVAGVVNTLIDALEAAGIVDITE